MKEYTVLIVDDERLVLSSIVRALRKEDYNLLTASSGQEGLMLLKEHDIHVVVSDQNMPGMTGLDFLKKVKKEYPHILTIMLTGKADLQVAVDAINEAGVYKFILKPWDDLDFKITIRRALESLQLILERDSLLRQVKTRDSILKDLEREHPGITKIKRTKDGYIISE